MMNGQEGGGGGGSTGKRKLQQLKPFVANFSGRFGAKRCRSLVSVTCVTNAGKLMLCFYFFGSVCVCFVCVMHR